MRYIIWYIITVLCLTACSKVEVDTYHAQRYVQFTRLYTDTVTLSFRFYPGVTEIRVPLEVKLIGDLLDKPAAINLVVDKENLTATSDIYGWDEQVLFKANQSKDTVYLILKKSGIQEGDQNTYTVVVDIENGNELLMGEINYTQRVFRVNNVLSRPDWWTAEVVKSYLGAYSDVKYQTFIVHVYTGDFEMNGDALTDAAKGSLRAYAIQFKNFLKRQNPPIMDGNVEMLSTVPVIGS